MRVLKRNPGGPWQDLDWETIDVDKMQKAVGGLLCVALRTPDYTVWCDDEGLMPHKAPALLNFIRPTDGSPIVGSILVTGREKHGESSGLSALAAKAAKDLIGGWTPRQAGQELDY